jgi:L-seryl-tRNA(Ser) seleniumtransferase
VTCSVPDGTRQPSGGVHLSAELGIRRHRVRRAEPVLRAGPDVYQSIGVRPLINARGTFTIISGSLMLPEVRAAMDAAAKHYVHLDELTEAVGARLAALTGAEWGWSHPAARAPHSRHGACVAGGNPDLHIRIPNLPASRRTK